MTGRKFPLADSVTATIVVDIMVFVEVNSMVVPGAVVVLTMVSSDVFTTVTDPSAVVVAVTVTTEPDALTNPVVVYVWFP